MAWSVGGFTVEALVGKGACGRVWSGRHATGVPVAIKTLDSRTSDAAARQRFEAEVRHVARLDHDAIVAILDYGVVPADAPPKVAGSPYLVMEHASGGTLAGAPPTDQAGVVDVLARLLDALAHAHARGIVHRDLKPTNVLRCTDQDSVAGWRLSDFGISLALDPRSSTGARAGTRSAGTPRYMAPEQITGRVDLHGPWTDLYALGGVGWWLATGRAVFAGEPDPRQAHLHTPPGRFVPRVDLASGFEAFLRRLLAKDPADRFQRAADARRALAELADWPMEPGLPARPDRPRRPRTPTVLRDAGLGLLGLRPVPFAGRDAEVGALWDAIRRVERTGRAEAVVVTGPRSLGKTRLVEEVVDRAEELGGIRKIAVPDGALGRLAAGLRALRPGSAEIGSSLVELRQALIRVARERTLVVWLDDAHVSPDGLDLVQRVIDGDDLDPAPLLFVVSGTGPALDRIHGPRIALGPLSPADQGQLIERMLGLDGSVAARLQQHTGGNPGFAVRVVESWVRRQLLRVTDRGLALVPGARLVVPPDLRGAWEEPVAELLADLSPAAVDALARLAVGGSRASIDEWATGCERAGIGARAREEAVDQLARRGLAVVRPDEVGLDGFVREAILSHLAPERVAAVHGEVAEALAEGPGASEKAGRIGFHLRAAGRADAAFSWLTRAIPEVIPSSYREAAALAAEAEDVGAELGLDDAALAPVRVQLAHALLGLGRVEEARLVATRAEEALPADAPVHEWILLHRGLGQIAHRMGRIREAAARYEAAQRIATERGGESWLAVIEADLGQAAVVAGDPERGLRLIASAEQRGWSGRNADFGRLSLGVALMVAGSAAEAEAVLHRVLPSLEALQHAQFLAVAHNALGELARGRGDLDEAARHYLTAADQFRIAGTHRVGIAWLNLAVVHVERRAYAEAARWAERAATLPAIDQDLRMCALAHACWLPCLAGLGRWEDWPKAFLEARARLLALEVPEPDTARMLDRAAELARAAGRSAEADEVSALAEREHSLQRGLRR